MRSITYRAWPAVIFPANYPDSVRSFEFMAEIASFHGERKTSKKRMSLASGHHRIMVAARGALVMMVLGKVEKGFFSTTHRSRQ